MTAENPAADSARSGSGTTARQAANDSGEVTSWLSRAAGGDESAWARLVERFAPTVWSAAGTGTSDPVISSEAAQATWLRLADRLAHQIDHSRLESWLIETVQREVGRSSRLRGLDVAGA